MPLAIRYLDEQKGKRITEEESGRQVLRLDFSLAFHLIQEQPPQGVVLPKPVQPLS